MHVSSVSDTYFFFLPVYTYFLVLVHALIRGAMLWSMVFMGQCSECCNCCWREYENKSEKIDVFQVVLKHGPF